MGHNRRKNTKRAKPYFEITVGDRSPFKRYLQRRRLRDAVRVAEDLTGNFSGKMLDFGGGSGELSRLFARRFPNARIFCYEPMPEIREEARRNLAGLENVTLVPNRNDLRGTKFDLVYSLEVFEHLPPRQTTKTLRVVDRLLEDGGLLIVGVPNEIFVPALVKGLFRMTRRYGAHDARFGNVLRAVLGRPPADRPVRRISRGLPYHFHHLGFDHRKLRVLLRETFDPVREFGSPVNSQLFGTEIYQVMKKRQVRETNTSRTP